MPGCPAVESGVKAAKSCSLLRCSSDGRAEQRGPAGREDAPSSGSGAGERE